MSNVISNVIKINQYFNEYFTHKTIRIIKINVYAMNFTTKGPKVKEKSQWFGKIFNELFFFRSQYFYTDDRVFFSIKRGSV